MVDVLDETFVFAPPISTVSLHYAYAVQNYVCADHSLSRSSQIELIDKALQKCLSYKVAAKHVAYAEYLRGRLYAIKAQVLRWQKCIGESEDNLDQAIVLYKESVKHEGERNCSLVKGQLAWALCKRAEWLMKRQEYNARSLSSDLNCAIELCKELLAKEPNRREAKSQKLHAEVLIYRLKIPRTNNSSQLKEAARSK